MAANLSYMSYISIFPDSEEGLKREGGAFDLETILFLDLSDRGSTPVHVCVPSHLLHEVSYQHICNAFLPLPLPSSSSPPLLLLFSSSSPPLPPPSQPGLHSVGSLPKCSQLRILNLSCNHLTSAVALGSLPNLEQLDLSANQIASLGQVTFMTVTTGSG